MAEVDLVAELKDHHEKIIDGEEYCEACGCRWPCAAIRAVPEIERLRDLADQLKVLRAFLQRKIPQAHWCDDWDGLLIGPGDVEYEECCSHRAALPAPEPGDADEYGDRVSPYDPAGQKRKRERGKRA